VIVWLRHIRKTPLTRNSLLMGKACNIQRKMSHCPVLPRQKERSIRKKRTRRNRLTCIRTCKSSTRWATDSLHRTTCSGLKHCKSGYQNSITEPLLTTSAPKKLSRKAVWPALLLNQRWITSQASAETTQQKSYLVPLHLEDRLWASIWQLLMTLNPKRDALLAPRFLIYCSSGPTLTTFTPRG
jgi:hypothetical protein